MYLNGCCNVHGLSAGYTMRRPSMPLITIAPGSNELPAVSNDPAQAYPVSTVELPQAAPIPAYSAEEYAAVVPQPDQQSYQGYDESGMAYETPVYIPPAPYIPQSSSAAYTPPPPYIPESNGNVDSSGYMPPPPYIPSPVTRVPDTGATYDEARAFYESLPQNQPASHYIEMYGEPQTPLYYPQPQQEYSSAPTIAPEPVVRQPEKITNPVQTNVNSSGGGASITFNPNVITNVPTNVATQVSPQISPVFVQQQEPKDSGVNTGISTGDAGYGDSSGSEPMFPALPGGGGGGASYMNTPRAAVSAGGTNWLPWLAVAAVLGIMAMQEPNEQRK